MYSVFDENAMYLSEGLQGPEVCDEAAQAAQYWADQLGKPVWVGPDEAEWEDLIEVRPGENRRRL